MCFVDLDERAGDGEAQRAGLTRVPAAIDVGLHVIATERVGRDERLLGADLHVRVGGRYGDGRHPRRVGQLPEGVI